MWEVLRDEGVPAALKQMLDGLNFLDNNDDPRIFGQKFMGFLLTFAPLAKRCPSPLGLRGAKAKPSTTAAAGALSLTAEEAIIAANKAPLGSQVKAAKRGNGVRYIVDKENHIRVDPGPNGAHVHVVLNGAVLDWLGKNASGLPKSASGRHIPMELWKNWKTSDSPITKK